MHLIENDDLIFICIGVKSLPIYFYFLYKGIAKQLLSGSKWFHALVWVAGVFLMLANVFFTVLCEMYSMPVRSFYLFYHLIG